jgi:hypothetical protein
MRGISAVRAWFLRSLLLVSVSAALCGCELIADFDRGKLPGASTLDASFRPLDAGSENDADSEDASSKSK